MNVKRGVIEWELMEHLYGFIKYAKEKGCSMTGTEDINIERLNVLK